MIRHRHDDEEFVPIKKQKTEHEETNQQQKSLSDLPKETLENICSSLIYSPRSLLSISEASKMFLLIIRSRATWVNLGFTKGISKVSVIPAGTLKLFFAALRIQHLELRRKQIQRELDDLTKIKDTLPEPDLDVGAKSLTVVKEQPDVYMTNRTITDEACIALMDILQSAPLLSIDLYELIDLILVSEEQLQTRDLEISQRQFHNTYQDEKEEYEVHLYDNHMTEQYNRVFKQSPLDSDSDSGCEIWKRFVGENKSVLIINSELEENTSDTINTTYVIKYDKSRNMLEVVDDMERYMSHTKEKNSMNKAYAKLLDLDPEINRSDDWAEKELAELNVDLNWELIEEYEPTIEDDEIAYNIKFLKN